MAGDAVVPGQRAPVLLEPVLPLGLLEPVLPEPGLPVELLVPVLAEPVVPASVDGSVATSDGVTGTVLSGTDGVAVDDGDSAGGGLEQVSDGVAATLVEGCAFVTGMVLGDAACVDVVAGRDGSAADRAGAAGTGSAGGRPGSTGAIVGSGTDRTGVIATGCPVAYAAARASTSAT